MLSFLLLLFSVDQKGLGTVALHTKPKKHENDKLYFIVSYSEIAAIKFMRLLPERGENRECKEDCMRTKANFTTVRALNFKVTSITPWHE